MEIGVFESPGREWDEFVSRHTDLVFYRSVWSEVLRKGFRGQPLYYYLKEGRQIVAGLPGVLLHFNIFKIFYASIPYGNLVGERSYFPLFMEFLEEEFRKKRIDQVRITDCPFSESYQPGSFKPISARCSLLDLRGVDKERILDGYKKYIRRDIRKAQRSGLAIRSGASKEDARAFYQLYLASMERNKAAAKYPCEWFETISEEMTQRGFGAFLFAELNGTKIAGVVLIHSATTTHYFHNGSRPEFLRLCPNELLVHFSLEKALECGNAFFDFMGSDPMDHALLKFKEKWGSQTRDLHTYVKDYHPFRCRVWELGRRWMGSSLGSSLLRMIRTSELKKTCRVPVVFMV